MKHDGILLMHQHGANALLRLRTVQEYYSDPISAGLFGVSYMQMVTKLFPLMILMLIAKLLRQLLANIQAGKPPPLPVEDIVVYKQYWPHLFSNSNTFVIGLFWKVARLHSQWLDIRQDESPPCRREDLRLILQTALDLDAEYQLWESFLPPSWIYQAQSNTQDARSVYNTKWRRLILEGRGAPTEIHTYPHLRRCYIWSFYRTTRILLLRDTLEIINYASRLPAAEIEYEPLPPTMSGSDETTLERIPILLDNESFIIYHFSTTECLIDVVEKSCSAVLANFTVPIYGKDPGDVMGLRGLSLQWILGTMDSLLSSGLIADSSPQIPSTNVLTADGAPRRVHVFDLNSIQPNSKPIDVSSPTFDTAYAKTMNVAARREWLNRMLYYIGTELGIKKALAVPFTEGYLPIVKPEVDDILGR